MGRYGPIPKRSDQRRRRNKPNDQAITKVTMYECGCWFLSGYDSLGRRGWRRRCAEHAGNVDEPHA